MAIAAINSSNVKPAAAFPFEKVEGFDDAIREFGSLAPWTFEPDSTGIV